MAGAALGEPRSADFVAGAALGGPGSADFVAGTAPGEVVSLDCGYSRESLQPTNQPTIQPGAQLTILLNSWWQKLLCCISQLLATPAVGGGSARVWTVT